MYYYPKFNFGSFACLILTNWSESNTYALCSVWLKIRWMGCGLTIRQLLVVLMFVVAVDVWYGSVQLVHRTGLYAAVPLLRGPGALTV